VLGVNPNPVGSDQFVAGRGPGDGTNYARAQRDITWGDGYWEITYDACGLFLGTAPTANNLGSYSVQPYPGSQSYIHLFSFPDIANPVAWQAFYLAYDAAGVAHTAPGKSPGAAWENLEMNHWYRFTTVIDFDANQIVYVTVTDLMTGLSDGFVPPDWYCQGGQAGGQPDPTGFRFFAGGGTNSDNVVAWDNYGTESRGMYTYLEGACPGTVRIHAFGGTPGGKVAMVAGTKPGQFTNPGNPCPGITLSLKPPFLAGFPKILNADANGHVMVQGKMPKALCGKLLWQFVDLKTCTKSNIGKK
jgi:hypothetical protein